MSSEKEKKTEERQATSSDEIDRHRLFSALLFGRQEPRETSLHDGGSSESESSGGIKSPKGRQSQADQAGAAEPDAADVKASLSNRLDGVLNQIDEQIPHDPIALREKTLYKGAKKLLQWQRDNYLGGKEYADWRRNDRRREQQQQQAVGVASVPESFEIPFDPTALSHPQVAKLASDFIPTPTVVKALTPIVASLPTGALYDPVRDSTLAIIEGQQDNLEGVIKTSLLGFLDNPQNRAATKNSTQGMLIRRTNNKESSVASDKRSTNTETVVNTTTGATDA